MIFRDVNVGAEKLHFIPGDYAHVQGADEILTAELGPTREGFDFHYVRQDFLKSGFRPGGFVLFLVGPIGKIKAPVDAVS